MSTSSLTNFAANSNDVNNRTMQKAKKATISEKKNDCCTKKTSL